jgi:lipopolysaccharide transport system ATP-binding protein
MSTVIKVENLSKQYRLGQVGTGTLSHDVNRWWHKIRGKEDPYLKIGESNDSDYVWALKDINFEVKQGEVLGIIGRNGAGKSTLLKILSRTTAPTTGSVKIKGRVASLLEVGTGFHPELSGRDNIFLNGAILGMTRREIQSNFDEIVDFAGVERYIDTPVKRYSSGMYVRLAFAVAAHLEPEILIVDEVLAVGDVEFQKKALGKMKDVSEKQGRTVLFVSHNLSAISKLCNSAMLLSNGHFLEKNTVTEILDTYSSIGNKYSATAKIDRDLDIKKLNKKLAITSVEVQNQEGQVLNEFSQNDQVFIVINFDVLQNGAGYNVGMELWNQRHDCILTTKLFDSDYMYLASKQWNKGKYGFKINLPSYFLKEGKYYITAAAAIPVVEMLDTFPAEVNFVYRDFNDAIFKSGEGRNGIINPVLIWEGLIN